MTIRRPPALRAASAALAALALLAACGGAAAPPPPTPRPAAPAEAPAPEPATAAPAPAELPTEQPALAPTPPPTELPAASPTESLADAPTEAPAETRTPPPTMTPAPLARTLAAGSQGDDVRLAQRVLLALGYTSLGEADGAYGPQTAAAVREFQRRAGLDADGVVGPKTWRALLSPDAPAAEGAGPLTPLVDSTRGWLLGAARDGRWVDQGAAAILMRGGERYTRYAPGGAGEPVTGSAPGPIGTPCDDTQTVLLDPPGGGVAVGEGLDARPRPASQGDVLDEALLGRVRDLLRANGIASPEIASARVLEADLDGDGAAERVVEATRIKGSDADAGPLPDAAAGDYSLVAVFPAKGEPTVLIGQYHPADETFTAPEQFQVDDLLDLNGDGRLEVVVYSRYYEGAATSVFALDGGKVTEALVNGCGV